MSSDESTSETKHWFKKNGIAFSALLLASLSFLYTYRNAELQNARWTTLNEPKFEIYPGEFYMFGQMDTPDKLWATNYKPAVYPIFDQLAFKSRYGVYTQIAFWDPKKNIPTFPIVPMQTDEDIKSETQRLNIQGLELRKHSRVRFPFRNLSQLPAINLKVKYAIIFADRYIKEDFAKQKDIVEVPAQYDATTKMSYVEIDLLELLDAHKTLVVVYRVWLEYDFEGNHKTSKQQWFGYHSNQNRWEGPYDEYHFSEY